MKATRYVFAALLCTALGCSETPEEAAQAHNILVTDGFSAQAGVLVTKTHFVTPLKMVESADEVQIVTPKNRGLARVTHRAKPAGVALMVMVGIKESGASMGEAAAVADGAPLTTYVYDAKGNGQLLIGTAAGFRYARGKAWLQTDIPMEKGQRGSGVYGADGKLVGVLWLAKGPGLTFILPAEYINNGPKSVIAHPDARNLVDGGSDSAEFAKLRAEGAKHTEELPAPSAFGNVEFDYYVSKTALLGALTMLSNKDAPVHTGGVTYAVHAIDVEHNRKPIAEGTIPAAQLKWHSDPAAVEARAKALTAAYGAAHVAESFSKYNYGDLRFRIPFAPFCSKVTAQEAHILEVAFADGRKSGEMGFQDLVTACSGGAEGDGIVLESQWGFEVAKTAPSKKGGKKRKKKKRRR